MQKLQHLKDLEQQIEANLIQSQGIYQDLEDALQAS